MGLVDAYTDAGPISMYEQSIMAVPQGVPDEVDFHNILYTNNAGRYVHCGCGK